MPRSFFTAAAFLLVFFMAGQAVAQDGARGISIAIEKDLSPKNSRLVTLVVVLKNLESKSVSGQLTFSVPEGLQNINAAAIAVALQPLETRYLPVKFLVGTDAAAGASVLVAKLTGASGELLASARTVHSIEINKDLVIAPLAGTIYRSDAHGPVTVSVKVDNLGNVAQDVTILCKFPDPATAHPFATQLGTIGARKDSVFTFTFLPSKLLAAQPRYSVSISGFRNPENELFGGSTVVVQNTSSVQFFQPTDYNRFSDETQNYVTTSYRSVGSDTNVFQLSGAGGANLPGGSLFVRGNIALIDGQENPLVTNTSITFAQARNQLTVGSINKQLDMPLSGRGVSFSHVFEDTKKITFGFVDQNYNLAEKDSWLRQGYGFYGQATLFHDSSSKNLSASYVYRHDPFEKAVHQTLGSELQYAFHPDWHFNASVNGGLSQYDSNGSVQPSFAVQSNYSGKIKNVRLNGNYFFSSDFYPGNRRGSLQLQQHAVTEFGGNSLRASATVSHFSPKFHLYDNTQKSGTMLLELGNRFPKLNDFTLGLVYQFQSERSNTYGSFFGGAPHATLQQLRAHRLIEQVSWVGTASRQAAVLAAETGLASRSWDRGPELQLKFNGNYSFRNVNLNAVYQRGGYYLSEYAFSTLPGGNRKYTKLNTSLFYNSQFWKDQVVVNTGLAYIDDAVYGQSPSVFVNSKYTGRRISSFLNTSWYQYSSGTVRNRILTVEVGLTVQLGKTILNPNKKGTLQVLAFYDRNTNGVFDEGEAAASDFNIKLGAIVLQTDRDGTAYYKRVPFGSYALQQLTQQGWYYDDATVVVDQYTDLLLVPLRQSGSLQGAVVFDYNAKTDLVFEQRASGIAFAVLRDNQLVKKLYTDDDGKFTSFLPTGTYTLVLDERSLPAQTFCATKSAAIEVASGQILVVPAFHIRVKEKKINTKKFTN